MVTKEAVYDPPRPTPVEAQDTINEHVMEQVRTGISCFGSSPWNFNVLAIKKAENKYDKGKASSTPAWFDISSMLKLDAMEVAKPQLPVNSHL